MSTKKSAYNPPDKNKPVNPSPFLQSLLGKAIIIKLKWGMEYKGVLASIDPYMNLQLADTDEFIDDSAAGRIGDVVVRCNNVLYIRGAPEEYEEEAEAEMPEQK